MHQMFTFYGIHRVCTLSMSYIECTFKVYILQELYIAAGSDLHEHLARTSCFVTFTTIQIDLIDLVCLLIGCLEFMLSQEVITQSVLVPDLRTEQSDSGIKTTTTAKQSSETKQGLNRPVRHNLSW